MLCVWDVGVLRAQQFFGSATIFVRVATCQFIRTEDYYLLNQISFGRKKGELGSKNELSSRVFSL